MKLLQRIRSNQGLEVVDILNCNSSLFNLEELKIAEKEVIRSVQQRHFREEIVLVQNKNCLKSSSKILRLDQFLD